MREVILLVITGLVLLLTSAKPENEPMFSEKLDKSRDSIDWMNSVKSIDYLQNNAEFSPENLRRLVEYLDFPDTEVVLEQACLETGRFKQNVYTKHKNLFALHFPRKRNTYASGWYWGDTGKEHKVSHFCKWQDAVFDYKEWISYWENVYIKKRNKGKNIILSNEDFEKFLVQCNFSSNKWKYIAALKDIQLWF